MGDKGINKECDTRMARRALKVGDRVIVVPADKKYIDGSFHTLVPVPYLYDKIGVIISTDNNAIYEHEVKFLAGTHRLATEELVLQSRPSVNLHQRYIDLLGGKHQTK